MSELGVPVTLKIFKEWRQNSTKGADFSKSEDEPEMVSKWINGWMIWRLVGWMNGWLDGCLCVEFRIRPPPFPGALIYFPSLMNFAAAPPVRLGPSGSITRRNLMLKWLCGVDHSIYPDKCQLLVICWLCRPDLHRHYVEPGRGKFLP